MNFLEKLQQLEVEAMTTDEVYATWGTTKEQAHEQLLELVRNENHKAQARCRKAASNEAADNLKAIITARLARMKGYEDLGDKDKTPKASTAKRAFERKDPGYVKKIIDRQQNLDENTARIRAEHDASHPTCSIHGRRPRKK